MATRVDSKKRIVAKLTRMRVMKASDLQKSGSGRVILGRLVDEGEIISLGTGLYASPSLDPFVASVIAVSKFYPKTVVSNLTALVIHRLSDERLDRIDVDIERNQNIRNQLMRVHRVPKKRLIGIEKMNFSGQTISIYDVERTLCEAYRLDQGGPIFFKALKRYLKNKKPDTKKTLKYDRLLRTRVTYHLQQELADD